ncbi:MAG: hypothetical protein PHO05_05050 [bacterium]|nr:hypothetical protein [bacterium]
MRKAGWVKIIALAICMATAGTAGYISGGEPSVGAISLSHLQGLGLPGYTPPQSFAAATGTGPGRGTAEYVGVFLTGLSKFMPAGINVRAMLQKIHNSEYQDEERSLIAEELSYTAKSLAQAAEERFREKYAARRAEMFSDKDPVLLDLRLKIINAELRTLYASPAEKDGLNADLEKLRKDLDRELFDRRGRISTEMGNYKKLLQEEIKARLSSEASDRAAELRLARKRDIDELCLPLPVPEWSSLHVSAWSEAEKGLNDRKEDKATGTDYERRLRAEVSADKRQKAYNDKALRAISTALAAENGLTVVIGGAVPLHNCVDLTAEAADILKKGRQ